MPSMAACRLMFSRMLSTTSKNATTITSHISHAVRITTFSVMVTANSAVKMIGTTNPAMSAPRFRRG